MLTPEETIAELVVRGVPLHVAQGAAANMRVESRLDPSINEIAPLVEGSRGGYGLNQWTGPRRRQYEAFAAQRGVDPSDTGAQFDFTVWELNNTERAARDRLYETDNATDAARVYSDAFLRPGIPHMDRRLEYAEQFSAIQPSTRPANALMPPRIETPKINAFRIERV